MPRSRTPSRVASKKIGQDAIPSESGYGTAVVRSNDEAVSRAIVALHSAADPAGVFAAMRRYLREEVSFSFIAFLLRGRPRERETFLRCAGQPRPSDFELRASLELAEEARRRRKRKLIRVTLSENRIGSGKQTSGASSRAHPALLLGFDGSGYAQASLLVARPRTSGDFRANELEAIERLRGHATAALRVVRNLQRERVTRLALQKLLSRFPVGVVLLDWEGRALYRNAAAAELCAHWNYGGEGRSLHASRVFRVPKEVVRAARSLDAGTNSRTTTEIVVSSPARPGVRAVVQSVRFEVRSLGRPRYLVHFEPVSSKRELRSGPTRMDLLLRLSPRERELAEVVSGGASNAEAAHRLGKSVYTVKKQLQGVYRKLGVKSRARLAAVLAR